jgi:hypothetical protein
MQYIKANGTKIIFMIAVFSFLGVSIPHVAAIFRMYEPVAKDMQDIAWNVCSFAAAAGIDILAGWLTLVMMNKDARGRDKAIIWAFIIALMVFSWYCNWLFDMLNSPHPVNVWSMTVINLPFIGIWTVDQLTPLIVSALPVFIVAYASIAHLVGVKNVAPVISLEELKQKAAEAQERAAAQVTIIKAQNMVNEEKATTAIGFGKTLWNKTINRGEKAGQNEVQSDGNADPKQPPMEAVKTPELERSETPSEVDIEDVQSMPQAEYPDDVLSVLVKFPKVQSWLSTSQRTATIEQVVEITGLSKRRLMNRLKDGTLKRNSRNANLVHINSVIEYLKTDPITNRLTGDTGEMPTLQLVANR